MKFISSAGVVLALALAALSAQQPPADGAVQTQARYRAALAEFRLTGSRGPAFRAFIDALPKANGMYVLEGDMLMTETEIFQSYIAIQVAQKTLLVGPELKVNLNPNGDVDVYPKAQRRLTYAIDHRTFQDNAKFQVVVDNMAKATGRWVGACPTCGVSFVHDAASDAAPSSATVNFIVRNFDAKGEYIAASFFPHDSPQRRFLNLDPTYYSTTFDQVGVLRHELGHVLGYRHEHIEGIPGCYNEASNWKPLTPYDNKSVMHYFCGGGGTATLDLTQIDIDGHRKAYAVP
jgi:hypothetical protein